MASSPLSPADVQATVIEVLPSFGLAWLQDDQMREWAVTRSTPGVAFDELLQGQRVSLHVTAFGGRQIADGCH